MADTDISLSVDLEVKDAEKTAKDLQKEIEKIFDSRRGEQSASLTGLEIQMKKNYDAAKQLGSALDELGAQRDTAKEYFELTHAIADSEKQMASMQRVIEQTTAAASRQLDSPILFEDNVMINTIDELNAMVYKIRELIREGQQTDEETQKLKSDLYALMDVQKAYNDGVDNTIVSFGKEEMTLGALKDRMYEVQESVNALKTTQEGYGIDVKEVDAARDAYEKLNMQYNQTEIKLDSINDKLKQQYVHYNEIETKEADRQALELQKQLNEQVKEQAEAQRQARMEMVAANSSLMALNMTIRSIGRLIPGVSTKAVSAIFILGRGILRLTKLTKDELIAAVFKLGDAVGKVLSFIAAHPVVLAIAAVVAAIAGLVKAVKGLFDETRKQVDELFEVAGNYLAQFGELAKDFVGTLAEGFFQLGNAIPSLLVKVTGGLVNKLKSLKSMVSEGLKSMAKWNDGNNAVNKSLSNITSSLEYLKASITAAIAPVITYVEPTLTRLIDLLAKVFEYIGMIIARITGATTFQKAIRKQKDYAAALKETNGQLASFDKLNVINDNAGGESVDYSLFSLEDVDMPDWLEDLEQLGQKVGLLLKKFLKGIDWETIKSKAGDIGEDIAAFINGFFSIPDIGATIGETLGEGLNTVTSLINRFIGRLDGKQLGSQLGAALQTMVTTINWGEIGDIFSGGINKIAEALVGFTNEFSGADLGTAFTTFLQNALGKIDWPTVELAIQGVAEDLAEFFNKVFTVDNLSLLGTTLGNTINALFTGIKLFTETAEWSEWGKAIGKSISDFFETVDWEMTAQTIGNACLGILGAIKEAIIWLSKPENMSKIKEAVVDFFTNIPWKDIGEAAVEISRNLRYAFTDIWNALKDSGAFEEIIKLIVQFLQEKKNWEDLFAGFQDDVVYSVVWEKISGGFQKVINQIKSFFLCIKEIISRFISWFTDVFGSSELKEGDLNLSDIPEIGTRLKRGLSTMPSVKVDGYATGAVIPPNKPFLGVLGDQKNGTNIEAPLSTIKQAVAEVMGEMGINVVFDVQGDPNRIFKAVQKEATIYYNQTQTKAF